MRTAPVHAEPSSLPILAAQRVDADALARDAEQRRWIAEADRYRQLIKRLDTLINEAIAGQVTNTSTLSSVERACADLLPN